MNAQHRGRWLLAYPGVWWVTVKRSASFGIPMIAAYFSKIRR
jgi:hypothetical protein